MNHEKWMIYKNIKNDKLKYEKVKIKDKRVKIKDER